MLIRAAVIIVLGFIAYYSMLSSPFRVMDDRISIIENPAIKSTSNIPEIFKEGYFHDHSYYRPLINLSFMAEYHFFRLNSFYYNLDNLLLHVLNALLVFALVSRLVNSSAVGFWTGVLFVLHPVQWEAVCNVPGRAILLSAFFELSSFIFFLKYYRSGLRIYVPFVLTFFFLALLCKESAGMLPFVIAGFLALDQKRTWSRKIIYFWPFIIGIAAYIFLRKYFGITDVHQTSRPLVLLLGFITFLRSLITDLRLFFLPVDLRYDRCLPFVMSLLAPKALATGFFWMVASVIFIFNSRKIAPLGKFLVLWFFLEMLPVSQLVASIGVGAGHISTAEHFLYLAAIPVLLGMVIAFRKFEQTNKLKNWVNPAFLRFFAAGFLIFLMITSVEQSLYASNEFNMISRSLSFEPNNPRVQAEMGMLSVFRSDIPDAQKHFEAAIKAEPLNPQYHIALGTALCQQGRWIEGLEQYVAFDPGKEKALVERQEKLTMQEINRQIKEGRGFDARGWLAIGIFKAKSGDSQGAIEAFLKTASINPSQADAWFNLGSIYEARHEWGHAASAYQELLKHPTASRFQREYAQEHLNTVVQKGYVEFHQQ